MIREIKIFRLLNRPKIGVTLSFASLLWSWNSPFSHVNLWKMPFWIVKSLYWHYFFRDLFFAASTWKYMTPNREIDHFKAWKCEMHHIFPVKTWIGYPYSPPQVISSLFSKYLVYCCHSLRVNTGIQGSACFWWLISTVDDPRPDGQHHWQFEITGYCRCPGPGPCITTATWRCRNNFSQWGCSFHWKLRCHWLEFLRQR